MSMQERRVERVLVMLDYGKEDPASGEVFDLTDLAHALATTPAAKHQDARIRLEVTAGSDYTKAQVANRWPVKLQISWQVMMDFHLSGSAGYLDDAINSSIPDSDEVEALNKRLRRAQKAAERIMERIKDQKIEDASKVRKARPIARVTSAPIAALAESSSS